MQEQLKSTTVYDDTFYRDPNSPKDDDDEDVDEDGDKDGDEDSFSENTNEGNGNDLFDD
jgi:hypothetical protein